MDSKTKKAIRLKVAEISDSARISRDGLVTFKRSYFYRHGKTAESFAAAIKSKLEAAGLKADQIDVEDHWAPWPGDSYFKAVFKIAMPEAANV